MKKRWMILGLALLTTVMTAGCGKKQQAQQIPTQAVPETLQEETETYTPEPVDTHEGEVRSFYTGKWLDKDLAFNRPVAVMTENTRVTLPQYGVENADIIYECPVEGGITRLMAIYQNYASMEKVGNVRSCRLYYVYFAKEFGAAYFHAGESKYALDVLNSSFIDNVDGITGKGGSYYYRDSSRKAPHNLYTTGEKLSLAMQNYGYDTTLPENYTSHYRFATEENPNLLDDGETAKKVSLYYVDAKPWFVYNETDELYYRYEFGQKQVDGTSGQQLAAKNIILQNCNSYLKNSENGTLDIDYLSGGSGKFITNGKAVDITWKRASAEDITHYYDANGQEIVLNPGKTWVEIIESSRASQNTISAEE